VEKALKYKLRRYEVKAMDKIAENPELTKNMVVVRVEISH